MSRLPDSRPPAKEIPLVPVDDSVPLDSGLEAEIFWEENKSKILGALAVVLLAVVAFGVWKYTQTQKQSAAATAFNAAQTPEQLQALIAQFPGSVTAGNAQILLADKLRNQGKFDEAATVLGQFMQQQPEHPLLADATLAYASTLEMKKDFTKATETYDLVANKYLNSQAAPAALASQARLAQSNGDLKKARSTYENLVQRFPDSAYARMAQQEIDRLPKE